VFTGLIREMGTVTSFQNNTLSVTAVHQPKLGDSIAINGACLSVVALTHNGFSVELSPETQRHIALERLRGKIHVEPAMMMGDRFEGHMVQGHIDTIGTVTQITNNGNSYDVIISVDAAFIPLIVPKGAIAIDGVSLTVNEVFTDSFRLTIIPITMTETLFGSYTNGVRVNIETDMFARYIRHILQHPQETLSWDTVTKMTSLY